MLTKLVVENLALIDHLDLDLEAGLIVLSGETGAGKSLVLDALSLILGYRASADLIRAGEDRASVQAIFYPDEMPEEYRDLAPDGQLIVAREISRNGRSVARINGQLVTVAALRELGRQLVDLHGQHEHQSLLTVSKHRAVLDRFAGENAAELLMAIGQVVADYRQVEARLAELLGDERQRQQRLDMLRFQAEEIAAARLTPDEEGLLLTARQRLANHERLSQAVEQAYTLLAAGDPPLPAVTDQLAAASAALNQGQHYDEELKELAEALLAAFYELEEVARGLRVYRDDLVYDPGELQEVEERLDLLSRLKRKYADSVAGVILYGEKAEQEIMDIENSGELVAELKRMAAEHLSHYRKLADKLSLLRQETARRLEEQILLQLKDLGLKDAVLLAQVKADTRDLPQLLGRDAVEFLFSANPGEEPKPLTRVISGGEMSRVMLGLKTLLAEHDPVGTLVFDEIDAGLGGRLAVTVGEKLRELAGRRQVICVSHLANIAAMADQHLFISKDTEAGATYTRVMRLTAEERVGEIARMLDGQGSSIATQHAIELLTKSKN